MPTTNCVSGGMVVFWLLSRFWNDGTTFTIRM